jgi:hypothetical protein
MTSNFNVFLRYSDAGHELGRTDLSGTFLEGITKEKILKNFFSVFDAKNVTVIADNVKPESIEHFKKLNVKDIHVTNLGNLKGWRYLFTYITQESGLDDEDIISIQEDDYLNFPEQEKYLRDGLNISHYSSTYDHLDKYINTSDGGNNPLISGGGEITRVVLGKCCHWKYTNSLTGTFSAKLKTLKEDYDLFMKYAQDGFPHPYDFLMCREMVTQRNRILATCLPGRSSHVGLEMSPYVNWEELVNSL